MQRKKTAPARALALPPGRPMTVHLAPRKRRRARNASVASSGNALSQAAPAIGAGLVTGIGALELAKRMNLTPMATAGILAAAGLAGTMLAPKGALQTMSVAALGLGTGLAGLELWQDRSKSSPKPQPAALPDPGRRQASYATREDVQDAVRAELAQHHQALASQLAQMRDERNAPAWFGENDDERNAGAYDDDGDLDERNAPAWFGESDERNADGYAYDDHQQDAV